MLFSLSFRVFYSLFDKIKNNKTIRFIDFIIITSLIINLILNLFNKANKIKIIRRGFQKKSWAVF